MSPSTLLLVLLPLLLPFPYIFLSFSTSLSFPDPSPAPLPSPHPSQSPLRSVFFSLFPVSHTESRGRVGNLTALLVLYSSWCAAGCSRPVVTFFLYVYAPALVCQCMSVGRNLYRPTLENEKGCVRRMQGKACGGPSVVVYARLSSVGVRSCVWRRGRRRRGGGGPGARARERGVLCAGRRFRH